MPDHNNNYRFTLLFIDGVGIGEDNPDINPLVTADLPNIRGLLGTTDPDEWLPGINNGKASLKALDACLGIDGLPQSATGHTSIYTGVNAPRYLGRHLQGFPNGKLRILLKKRGILPVLERAGYKTRFVNAYHTPTLEEYRKRKRPFSATSVMAMEAYGAFPPASDIPKRKAVYHDITGRSLRCRGEDIDLISPETAGGIVAELSRQNDFTLYEYFLTDFAGHRRKMHRNIIYLETYDRFLGAVVRNSDLSTQTILLISDHGNAEDLSVKTHTKNPVPFIAIGKAHIEFTDSALSITDPYFLILEKLGVAVPELTKTPGSI